MTQPAFTTGRQRVKTMSAAAAGNFAEWYDWGVYGVVATLIATHFFPNEDPAVGLMSAYALFAVSYITRPLGGLVFGYVADKLGRRKALSTTILLTCGATALIGLLPTYDQIGVLAPALLLGCRLVQAIGTGGEYASAITFVYEHSPDGKKARYVSGLISMTFAGILVGSLAATVVSALMSPAAYEAWGWRILFLLALPMGAFGLYLRSRTDEGPEFKQFLAERDRTGVKATPLRDVFTHQWRKMLLFCGFLATWALIATTITAYITTFLLRVNGMSKSQAYLATVLAGVMVIGAVLVCGRFADRIGLRKMMIGGTAFVAVLGVPSFLIAANGVAGGLIGSALLGLCKGVIAVPSLLAVSQIFPTSVRVTAGALSYNVTNTVFGGTAPLIGVWLNGALDLSYGLGVYLVVLSLFTMLIAAVWAKRWVAEGRQHLTTPARRVTP